MVDEDLQAPGRRDIKRDRRVERVAEVVRANSAIVRRAWAASPSANGRQRGKGTDDAAVRFVAWVDYAPRRVVLVVACVRRSDERIATAVADRPRNVYVEIEVRPPQRRTRGELVPVRVEGVERSRGRREPREDVEFPIGADVDLVARFGIAVVHLRARGRPGLPLTAAAARAAHPRRLKIGNN